VIGGVGFIGSYVTRLLVQSGREVLVLDRNTTPVRKLPSQVQYISGDYGERSMVNKLLETVDEVIDLAYTTVPKTSFDNPLFDLMSNLPPSIGLLEEARLCDIQKVVVISSGGTVYGAANELPISEEHPTNPLSPYGITKLIIEKYARMFFELYDLPVVIVRPGNAYGEGQVAFSSQGFISTAIQSIIKYNPINIYGRQGTIRDYIHVKDIARGIIATLEHGHPGEAYNIGSEIGKNNLDILNIFKPLAECEGYGVNVNILPARKFDVPANILSSRKLQQVSGWRHEISLEDGLRLTWEQALVHIRA